MTEAYASGGVAWLCGMPPLVCSAVSSGCSSIIGRPFDDGRRMNTFFLRDVVLELDNEVIAGAIPSHDDALPIALVRDCATDRGATLIIFVFFVQ